MHLSSVHSRSRQSSASLPQQWAALSIALIGLVWTTQFAATTTTTAAFTTTRTVPCTSFRTNNLRTSSASSSAFILSSPPHPSIPTTTTTTTTQLDLKRPNLLGGWSSRRLARQRGGEQQQSQPSGGTSNNSRIVVVAPRTSSSNSNNDDEADDVNNNNNNSNLNRRRRARRRIQELAKMIVLKPIRTATTIAPMPQAIAEVLKDATLNAVDMAVDEGAPTQHVVYLFLFALLCDPIQLNDFYFSLFRRLLFIIYLVLSPIYTVISHRKHTLADPEGNMIDVTALIDEAFLPMEQSLAQVEAQLAFTKQIMQEAKLQSIAAMSAVEAAAIAQAEGAAQAVAAAEKVASRTALAEMYVAAQNTTNKDSFLLSDTELSRMTFEDVDYGTSEMAPPFLNDDQCLIPGEPVVRVEKAPENSRRIFAGIDIPHSVDEVWALLTDYEHLSDVVPNLVVNQVLEEYNNDFCKDTTVTYVDSNLPEEVQCRDLANQMKGALLRQGELGRKRFTRDTCCT